MTPAIGLPNVAAMADAEPQAMSTRKRSCDGRSARPTVEPIDPPICAMGPSIPALMPEPSVIEDKTTIVEDDSSVAALFSKLRAPTEIEPESAPQSAPAEKPVAKSESSPLRAVPDQPVGEGFDRRDRMLLPIENTALRGLKRRIVELQNRVLEELRTSGGEYRLGHEFVAEMMGDDMDVLLTDSYRAGHTAAAESMGEEEPQLTSGGPHRGAAETFSLNLHGDIQDVLRRGVEIGSRRLSSDVSRVFRGWRTDEAERLVRMAARRAFNDGLVAGYQRLGVPEVELVAPGRPCGACAADSGVSWAPGIDRPPGGDLPPVSHSCGAMVVPKGSNGFDKRLGQ